MKAIELLNFRRFDIIAKYVFLHFLEEEINCNWGKTVYSNHLKVWNNFQEKNPPRNCFLDFEHNFLNIIQSIKTMGFNPDVSKIPIMNNSAINGSHRIATSIYFDKEVETYEAGISEGQYNCSHDYFTKLGLQEDVLDYMALWYAKLKPNTFMATIMPGANFRNMAIFHTIGKKFGCHVVADQKRKFTKNGSINLLAAIYQGESWVGNLQQGYPGAVEKSNLCNFKAESDVNFVLFEIDNVDNIEKFKNALREEIGGQHSVHINDEHWQTERIAEIAFNKNTIIFLNSRRRTYYSNFEAFLGIYKDKIKSHNKEDFCISSSAVLSLLGVRDCNDVDFLHKNAYFDLGDKNLSSHHTEMQYYPVTLHNMIYHPEFYFYHQGFKFLSLPILYQMKKNRNEEKDQKDIALIYTLG